jgi:hypothetical protein
MRYGPKESPEKILKRRRQGRWAARCLRLVGATLRYRLEDPWHVLDEGPKPRIWVGWHNRLASAPNWYERIGDRIGKLYALISASGDGEILATTMAEFGINAIRGSKSRGGEEALRELLKQLRAGNSVVITPDGPRGPRYQLQEGVLKLAEWSGVEVVPFDFELKGKVELKTWDRLRISLPFGKSVMVIREPIRPPFDRETLRNNLITQLCE